MRRDEAALSFTVFTNSGKHYFSPESPQPSQQASHRAHRALKQVVGFEAIPSPIHKTTSKLPVWQVDGHNGPQLHFFYPSAMFLLVTFLLITSPRRLSSLTGRFAGRQTAGPSYERASPPQVSNAAVIIQPGLLHN